MSDELLGALIGLGGVVLGAILTFLAQIIIDKINSKSENRRSTYQLKIDTYADAIRYISLCCRINCETNIEEKNKLLIEECSLYTKFHPIFSLIAPKDVIEKYNRLRNEIDQKKSQTRRCL